MKCRLHRRLSSCRLCWISSSRRHSSNSTLKPILPAYVTLTSQTLTICSTLFRSGSRPLLTRLCVCVVAIALYLVPVGAWPTYVTDIFSMIQQGCQTLRCDMYCSVHHSRVPIVLNKH